MAAAPKPVRFFGMGAMSAADAVAVQYDPPARPMDQGSLAWCILQLQNTVNELISRHNALAVAAAQPATQVTGAGQAATNLFTNN